MSLYITQHALDRYKERFGGIDSPKSIANRENAIRRVVAFGRKVVPKDKLRVYLFNGCKDGVEHYAYRNIVALVENERVVTVFRFYTSEYEGFL